MQIIHNAKPYYTLIYDYYSEEELGDIWKELELLHGEGVLSTNPELTAAAKRTLSAAPVFGGSGNSVVSEKYIKQNSAVFLDTHYISRRHESAILRSNQRIIFKYSPFKEELLTGENPFNNYLYNINYYTTLLNYYEESDYYDAHVDNSCLSVLSYFWKEPKGFTGGDLIFPDYPHQKIELKNNCVLIFPSFQRHAVTKIEMVSDEPLSGRFSAVQFMTNRAIQKKG